MSQLDLELAIESAAGSISRIENGQTNPTKETLNKICKALELSNRETDYLTGKLLEPAGEEEIAKAVSEIKEYFKQKGLLAYMVDERFRILAISDTFFKFLNVSEELKPKVLNRPIVSILLDPEINLKSSFDPTGFKEVISNLLERFYWEVGFMAEDEYYKDAVAYIKADSMANAIWQKISSKKLTPFHNFERRKVPFKVGPFTISLYYSNEPLLSNHRFEVIEYIPTSKLTKILGKIL